jgi:hypothetical protein
MRRHEFTTAPPRAVDPETEIDGAPPTAAHDPLRFCVFTTVALIAWVAGAPAAVLLTSGLGIGAYWRARRDGVLRSRCVLGDTRLVLLYLAIVFAAAAVVLVRQVARR